MAREKAENEKQRTREIFAFDRDFIRFVLAALGFRYFYNPLVGRSEPSIDLNVKPSRNTVQRTESQALKQRVVLISSVSHCRGFN